MKFFIQTNCTFNKKYTPISLNIVILINSNYIIYYGYLLFVISYTAFTIISLYYSGASIIRIFFYQLSLIVIVHNSNKHVRIDQIIVSTPQNSTASCTYVSNGSETVYLNRNFII